MAFLLKNGELKKLTGSGACQLLSSLEDPGGVES